MLRAYQHSQPRQTSRRRPHIGSRDSYETVLNVTGKEDGSGAARIYGSQSLTL